MKPQNKIETGYKARYDALFQILKDYRTFSENDERKLLTDRIIASYQRLCEAHENPAYLRQCDIIMQKYINHHEIGNRELATKHFLHPRTIVRDVHTGMKTLMVLAYGIDGIQWEAEPEYDGDPVLESCQ